jgi:predicted nucleotidyltransferase
MTIWLPVGETLPDRAEAERLAARIRAARPDAEVWLFGSLARGRPRRHSDIDLAVVLPDDALAGRRGVDLAADLRRAAGPREHGLDLVLFRRSRFEARAGDPNAIEATIRREGVRLA